MTWIYSGADMVAWWLALLLHSKNVLSSNFLCLCGLYLGALVYLHRPKTYRLGQLGTLYCL